jgi:hypothetical protein
MSRCCLRAGGRRRRAAVSRRDRLATMNEAEVARLHVDALQKTLDYLRSLETWGSSLFLGAIAAVSKQLIEWHGMVDTSKRIELPSYVGLVPAVIGCVAFVFLRVVNFRGHRASRVLAPSAVGPTWGVLGWLFALMPLALGLAGTEVLVAVQPVGATVLRSVRVAGCSAVATALAIHVAGRWKERRRASGPR